MKKNWNNDNLLRLVVNKPSVFSTLLGREIPEFEIDPDTMYPATIEEIQLALAGEGVFPIRDHEVAAKSLPEFAWGLALTPRDQVEEWEKLAIRAKALELARLWFTERIHQAVDHVPMKIHILKSERWRL